MALGALRPACSQVLMQQDAAEHYMKAEVSGQSTINAIKPGIGSVPTTSTSVATICFPD